MDPLFQVSGEEGSIKVFGKSVSVLYLYRYVEGTNSSFDWRTLYYFPVDSNGSQS